MKTSELSLRPGSRDDMGLGNRVEGGPLFDESLPGTPAPKGRDISEFLVHGRRRAALSAIRFRFYHPAGEGEDLRVGQVAELRFAAELLLPKAKSYLVMILSRIAPDSQIRRKIVIVVDAPQILHRRAFLMGLHASNAWGK